MSPTSFDPGLLAYLTQKELAELDLLITSDPTVWRPLPGPQSLAYYSDADIIGYRRAGYSLRRLDGRHDQPRPPLVPADDLRPRA